MEVKFQQPMASFEYPLPKSNNFCKFPGDIPTTGTFRKILKQADLVEEDFKKA